jgi:hypothetical protein
MACVVEPGDLVTHTSLTKFQELNDWRSVTAQAVADEGRDRT